MPIVRSATRASGERGIFSPSHGEDDPTSRKGHGLGRPHEGIEELVSPGIPDLAALLSQLPRRFDIGQKGMTHHLDRLGVEGKLALNGLLQDITVRPGLPVDPGLSVMVTTQSPGLGSLDLAETDTAGHTGRYRLERMDLYNVHTL